jgi:hypothetical protein
VFSHATPSPQCAFDDAAPSSCCQYLKCLADDPSNEISAVRRELLDVVVCILFVQQDAYYHIEKLFDPDGYLVTRDNGIPRFNLDLSTYHPCHSSAA